jgi:hypothetical protein
VLRSAALETESAISPSTWADWHPAIKRKMTTNNNVRIFVSDASGQTTNCTRAIHMTSKPNAIPAAVM